MTRYQALELTRGIKISDNENDLCFKAMMIFWIGANYNYDKIKTAKTTKYSEEEVEVVFSNWEKNKILVGGKIYGEFNGENDWMEIILISMCGAGELIRYSEKYGLHDKIENKMTQSKTLNEHLFETLNRLSEADADNINIEMNKAASIVSVSEQILSVARLKLDILQANAGESFSEIDNNTEQKQLGDGVKKK